MTIRKKIIEIILELVPEDDSIEIGDRLIIIGSSSLLSLHFITILEEYFDIEIDDEDITYLLFSNINHIENVVNKYIIR